MRKERLRVNSRSQRVEESDDRNPQFKGKPQPAIVGDCQAEIWNTKCLGALNLP
jgi:hypothetical protein